MPSQSKNKGFIMFMRGYDATIHKHPNAFNLLAVIAQRAKRTDSYDNKELEYGEAQIGDYRNYGMTERRYRTAKNWLALHGIITIKTTNKGTIAKIVDTSIFDINVEKPSNKTTGDSQFNDEQTTSNKNENNEQNENFKNRLEKAHSTRNRWESGQRGSESIGSILSRIQSPIQHES